MVCAGPSGSVLQSSPRQVQSGCSHSTGSCCWCRWPSSENKRTSCNSTDAGTQLTCHRAVRLEVYQQRYSHGVIMSHPNWCATCNVRTIPSALPSLMIYGCKPLVPPPFTCQLVLQHLPQCVVWAAGASADQAPPVLIAPQAVACSWQQ